MQHLGVAGVRKKPLYSRVPVPPRQSGRPPIRKAPLKSLLRKRPLRLLLAVRPGVLKQLYPAVRG